MDWRLDRMLGNTVSLVNRSGDDAIEVVVSAVGPVVVGGQRDWSRNFGRVHAGASIEVKYAKGWSSERPALRVTWHADGYTNQPRSETHWLS
jgi:hypothetical protein